MKAQNVQSVIQYYIDKKILKNPRYSMRAISRDLGFSPSFLTNILKGNKKFPIARLDQLFKVLNIEETDQLVIKALLRVNLSSKISENKGTVLVKINPEDISRINIHLEKELEKFYDPSIESYTVFRYCLREIE